MAAETPSKSTRSAATTAPAAAAAIADEEERDHQQKEQEEEEEEEKEEGGDAGDSARTIFRDLQFYLSYGVPHERRGSVRTLINEHGGIVLTKMNPNAIELVESSSLREGKPWVSVDFVYDSARDGMLRNVADYMARSVTRESARAAEGGGSEDRTPSKRRGRTPYTARDDVRMIVFLDKHYRKALRFTDNVPLSVWGIAAGEKVTSHSAASMHEHYQYRLKSLTSVERSNLLQNAAGEENAQRRKEIVRANYLASRKSAPATAGAARSEPPVSAVGNRSTTPAGAPDAPPSESSGSSACGASGAPFSEANFTSRWQQIIADRSRREWLQFFFDPASREAAAATTSASEPASAAASRRRRRSDAATAEQEQKREEHELPPPKKRKARTHAAVAAAPAQATAHATAHATARRAARAPPAAPPTQRAPRGDDDAAAGDDAGVSSESEIDHLVCQLQFETKQASDAVVNAIFYSSGDVAVATAFLRGANPSGFWSLEDDLLLEDLVRDATDARAVAAARRRGAFATMRVPRTTAQILTRIRYLL
ncbi:hypothetical protein PybrP1_008560 [[Pythium] brassicae (nom. inval.)]|nr:hypothetical protein PybrP1_008560 [[Pythium] brassicae (nom. inval.)]